MQHPDFNARIQQAENALEKLAEKIPGFRGYREKEHRRDADKLLRLTIASRVDEQWRRLTEIQRRLVAAGEFGYLDDLEGVAIRLRTFSDQLRTASYGYAGLFDAIKVEDEELARLYAYDLSLLDLTDEIKAGVDRLEAAVGTEDFPKAMNDLLAIARKAIEAFNRREEVILSTD